MAHEDLTRKQGVEGSSDRAFAVVFAIVFAIVGLWPWMFGGSPRWWALAVATGFVFVGAARPALLTPLNRLWMRFGLLLGYIVSPIALGVVYFLVLTPVGLLLRWRGGDPLRLKRRPDTASYWVPRQPPGPPPQSMDRQF
jgi:predicted membrane metal-binding protein